MSTSLLQNNIKLRNRHVKTYYYYIPKFLTIIDWSLSRLARYGFIVPFRTDGIVRFIELNTAKHATQHVLHCDFLSLQFQGWIILAYCKVWNLHLSCRVVGLLTVTTSCCASFACDVHSLCLLRFVFFEHMCQKLVLLAIVLLIINIYTILKLKMPEFPRSFFSTWLFRRQIKARE